MKLIVTTCLVASLTACVANNHGDDTEDPGNDPGTTIVPREGDWYYVDVTKISSTCVAGDDGTAGEFAIASPSLAGFTVIDGDTAPFACSLSGKAFNCPNRAAYAEDLRPSYDAVLTAHATADGTFTSATRASGTQQATVSCAGSACAAYVSWPCTFKVSFQIAAR
jgi:hypothetical protein